MAWTVVCVYNMVYRSNSNVPQSCNGVARMRNEKRKKERKDKDGNEHVWCKSVTFILLLSRLGGPRRCCGCRRWLCLTNDQVGLLAAKDKKRQDQHDERGHQVSMRVQLKTE